MAHRCVPRSSNETNARPTTLRNTQAGKTRDGPTDDFELKAHEYRHHGQDETESEPMLRRDWRAPGRWLATGDADPGENDDNGSDDGRH
jgi:hypothetical protein